MKNYPKKSLGQNFLRDPKILEKIVDAAHITKEDTVIEIGPGEGTLTRLLLKKAKKVIAIEKDEILAEKVKNLGAEIITGDALEYIPPQEPYILVGNIPYYITGEIFRKFLESNCQPKSLTFVVQKEVAERILARDGKESILSISVKAYGEPEYGGTIKAGSFYPAPKVDSAILSVRNISKSNFAKASLDETKFFEFVRKGFAHKRKLLSRNLEISEEILAQCGIPPQARAEELSIDHWFSLVSFIIHNS